MEHTVSSRSAWLAARAELMQKEKQYTALRDELSAARRALPWVKLDKSYTFETTRGSETLAQLFGGASQLLVYHFMFAPDWQNGCKSCSFWADSFNGVVDHLAARDIHFAAVSRAPLEKLSAQAQRLGWTFDWASSGTSDFNYDFQVSFDLAASPDHTYNYRPIHNPTSDLPGLSAFVKNEAGEVFHTYSCFSRGIESLNAAYSLLDFAPRGRDEAGLPFPMAWVKLRDQYGT